MEISVVGVVGAGTMGSGIAQVAAQAGLEVLLLDVSDALVNGAVDKIRRNLARSVEKGKLSPQQMAQVLERIRPTTDGDNLGKAHLIIEAVFEDLEFKVQLFKKLEAVCRPETIFASNTSTLSITRMASRVSPSHRFVGLHFFNPVPAMRLVEIIPALQTSQETVDACIGFARAIQKIPIRARDFPGFLVNRIFMPYAGEAMLVSRAECSACRRLSDLPPVR